LNGKLLPFFAPSVAANFFVAFCRTTTYKMNTKIRPISAQLGQKSNSPLKMVFL
jgi:hypothetical protein